MRKRQMSINLEPSLYDRIQKSLSLQEEQFQKQGWPKPRISTYCVHLIEIGLKAEQADRENNMKNDE